MALAIKSPTVRVLISFASGDSSALAFNLPVSPSTEVPAYIRCAGLVFTL
nr:MAG TPA: hypothetical protein [Bacteriophage sp.]